MTTTNETKLVTRKTRCANVKIDLIRSEWAHRLDGNHSAGKAKKEFDTLKKSIESQGIINPIVVKQNGDDTYTLIDGHRRLEAAKLLGYKKIRVINYKELEENGEILSLVANANQKALGAVELGIAYDKLIKSGVYRSNQKLAKALGLSAATVGSKIKNLELDKRIIDEIVNGNGATNDQKILKAIRLLQKTDESNVSQKQWEVYGYIKENNLGRKEALEYIKSQREPEVISERTVSLVQNNMIELHIDTSDLDEARKARIQQLVAEIERIRDGEEASGESLAA